MTVLEPSSTAPILDDRNAMIAIGAAHFTPDTRTLCVDGDAITLEPRISDLLMRLIGAGGRPVSREALLDDIWGLSGSDEALTQAISKLRRALNDTLRPHQIIQTVPKTGYRLGVAPRHAATAQEARSKGSLHSLMRPIIQNFQRRRSYWNGVLTGMGVSAVAAMGFLLVNPPQTVEIQELCAPGNGAIRCDLEFD